MEYSDCSYQNIPLPAPRPCAADLAPAPLGSQQEYLALDARIFLCLPPSPAPRSRYDTSPYRLPEADTAAGRLNTHLNRYGSAVAPSNSNFTPQILFLSLPAAPALWRPAALLPGTAAPAAAAAAPNRILLLLLPLPALLLLLHGLTGPP